MKKVFVENKKSTVKLNCKVLLALMTLAVIAGLGAAADAAGGDPANGLMWWQQMGFFDPFTLRAVSFSANEGVIEEVRFAAAEASGGSVMQPIVFANEGGAEDVRFVALGSSGRPPIRIPFRPPIRSPFRPPIP